MGTKNSEDRRSGRGTDAGDAVVNVARRSDLEDQLQNLREELQIALDRYARALADIKNHHLRVNGDANEPGRAARLGIVLPLLIVIDDIERSLKWRTGGEEQLVSGVRSINYELLTFLERQGVRPYDSVGEMFTPPLHEAVAVAEVTAVVPGTVTDQIRRGYFWNNEVLRPAQVRVPKQTHTEI